jgi:outer membrane protein assembly factor BamA
MLCRTALSSGSLFLVSMWLNTASICAQSGQPSVPCSPVDIASVVTRAAHPKAVIDDVRFNVPTHLSPSVMNRMIAEWNEGDADATNRDWVAGFVEGGIRNAWQDQGYFRVTVGRAETELLGGNSDEQHFRLVIPVNEGLQYHLGDLSFLDAHAFSPGELRSLIPLEEGEIFNISKIRAGIEALNQRYAANGFLDFTAVPNTEINDKLQRIALTFRLDEEKQYRIGDVRVIGLDPALEMALRSEVIQGEVFNPQRIDEFVKRNASSLPTTLSQNRYLQQTRDTKLGIIDLSFDFRALDSRGCPIR